MRKLFKALHEAQDGTVENMVFYIPDKISNENITNHKNLPTNIPETSQYFGTGSHNFDLEIGKEFDVIFSRSNPHEYINIDSKLNYLNFNQNIESDILPSGYAGVCLIDFPNGKPNLLNILPEFGSTEIGKGSDKLYLTTQSVMDKILENL